MKNSNYYMKTKYQYVGFLPNSVRIKENGYWGINDFEGNEILHSSFIEVFTLSSGYGLIAARDAGSWVIYDFQGNQVTSERFDYIYSYYGMFGLTKVRIGEKWGLINKYGKLIVPIEYKKIEKFGKGLILLNQDSKNEFIERSELFNLTNIKHTTLSLYIKKPLQTKRIISTPQKTKSF